MKINKKKFLFLLLSILILSSVIIMAQRQINTITNYSSPLDYSIESNQDTDIDNYDIQKSTSFDNGNNMSSSATASQEYKDVKEGSDKFESLTSETSNFLTEYLKIACNTQYTNINYDNTYGKLFDYYTDDFKNYIIDSKIPDSVIESSKVNETTINFLGIKSYDLIKSNNDDSNVLITVTYQLRYDHATNDFLESSGFKLHESYSFSDVFELNRINDTWKINKIYYYNPKSENNN